MPDLLCEPLLRGYLGVTLTPAQREALITALQWRKTGTHGVLEGFAGTGKTTVLTALVLELACRGEHETLHVAAPTHKAAKVLNDKIGQMCAAAGVAVPTEAGTIHSLLRLKPKRIKPGEPEAFVASGSPRLARGGFLILDECSMVGRALFDYTMECAATYGVTVLFSGDPKQLRPVNETGMSRSFALGEKVLLDEVLRHDGAVLRLATAVRTMHRFALPVIKTDRGAQSQVSAYVSKETLAESWLDQVAADHAAGSASSTVMLCWTNRERRAANRRARVRIYGPDVPEFMAGDELVMLAPLTRGDQVVLANNADIRITAAELVEWQPVEGLALTYSCWRLRVEGGVEIHVLTEAESGQHKRDWQRIGKEISAAVEQAKSAFADLEKRADRTDAQWYAAMDNLRSTKGRWSTEYYPLKEAFAQVDHRYALTVHKSQGSTYDTVFVHPDMLEAKDERPALMYVAVTRAAKEVHHLALG